MKKNYIIDAILVIAVAVLYVLHFTANDTKKVQETKIDSSFSSTKLPIAFVNIDSLLINYQYSKDLNKELTDKKEKAMASLNSKGKKLESMMKDFQTKAQNHAFLSEASYKSQQNDIVKKQTEFQALQKKLSDEMLSEQQKTNKKLQDIIYEYIDKINKDHKYQLIFSNTMKDNILTSEPVYDITKDLLNLLNKNYKPEGK